MKILITCPRAPISIEWIKIAKQSACEVILVDSLDYPISIFYDKKIPYVKVASPRLDFESYKKEMEKLFLEVDIIIPNCEDIFFLSKIKDETNSKALFFMPPNELLFELHNKSVFHKYLNSHIKIPKTTVVKKKDEIKEDLNTILKPVFSRFGRSVIRGVTKQKIKDIDISEDYPWVQQEYINGTALCNYAICQDGVVISHVIYKPKYLLNQAASTYFEYYEDKRLDNFIKEFAQNTNYTGQVAFDFIDDGKDIYILECNPRATSGLHLISTAIKIDKNRDFKQVSKIPKVSYRVGVSLFILFGIQSLLKGEFKTLLNDHKKAKDVLVGLPFYAQFISFYEMIKRTFIYKKPLTNASTFDIEYDGENK
ncbi:ATP-grasp domain-containing protein [Aliarcobacter butzleri]|uniref:ATP-grasp domain-containing protein n=1 Tax=Aliarcobacter butzleri TaxID=28197 RepID=UPI001EDAE5B7|nr:ATP-grasp domain-containing protein [Aliarcobacter butzleri]MCG3677654.1 ATP-grasp domain-containing protein [Aliarcobacter butzleri]